MGLDMTAHKTKQKFMKPVDFYIEYAECFHAWRNHGDLHLFMEVLYRYKGGQHEFNCRNVQLNNGDLDLLEYAVRADALSWPVVRLPEEIDGAVVEGDLKFIEKARAELAAGYTIFYSSWW